jgi:hypothetical protein
LITDPCVSMLSPVPMERTSTSRPVREVDCSYRTEAVDSKRGTRCRLNQKASMATRSVETMMMNRRRRTISQ